MKAVGFQTWRRALSRQNRIFERHRPEGLPRGPRTRRAGPVLRFHRPHRLLRRRHRREPLWTCSNTIPTRPARKTPRQNHDHAIRVLIICGSPDWGNSRQARWCRHGCRSIAQIHCNPARRQARRFSSRVPIGGLTWPDGILDTHRHAHELAAPYGSRHGFSRPS